MRVVGKGVSKGLQTDILIFLNNQETNFLVYPLILRRGVEILGQPWNQLNIQIFVPPHLTESTVDGVPSCNVKGVRYVSIVGVYPISVPMGTRSLLRKGPLILRKRSPFLRSSLKSPSYRGRSSPGREYRGKVECLREKFKTKFICIFLTTRDELHVFPSVKKKEDL